MKKNDESISQRLERLRTERGLTAKAVARQIEVPESTYREWEYGRGLRLPPCQKISQVFGISVSELITGARPEWQEYVDTIEKIEKDLREVRMKIAALI